MTDQQTRLLLGGLAASEDAQEGAAAVNRHALLIRETINRRELHCPGNLSA